MEPTEKSIERYLVREVEKVGGLCLKYANGNKSGYPDRLVMLKGGTTFWVELKSPGKTPRQLQKVRIAELRAIGQRVYVADSYWSVENILKKEGGAR